MTGPVFSFLNPPKPRVDAYAAFSRTHLGTGIRLLGLYGYESRCMFPYLRVISLRRGHLSVCLMAPGCNWINP